MKIRTTFIVTMILFGLLLTTIATSLMITNQQVGRLSEQEETAINVERGASELSYLSNDYLLYREEQQRARWQAKWTSVSNELEKLNLTNAEQEAITSNIKSNHRRLKAVFDNVASAFQGSSQGLSPESAQSLVQVSWSRMAVQNQSIAFDALHLSQVIRAQKDQVRQTNSLLIFVLLGAFGAYFVTNYLIVQRRLLQSIAELHSGTRVIGSGNLDFALEVKRDDEIGELSRAFNRMTTDLKGVTASKTELEREVAERKRAEEKLAANHKLIQEQNETLQQMNDELQAANEALASTNEELHTTTDELIAVQHELIDAKALSDALNDINATLNSTLDVDEIMQTVLAEGAGAIGSEAAAIVLRQDSRWVVRYLSNMPQELIGKRLNKEQVKHLEYVARTKEALVIEDTFTDDRINREFMREVAGIKSAIVLPLLAKGEVVGAVTFSYRSARGTFDEAQIDFANKLAVSISLALENTKLYEAQRDIANTLQGAILTVPERIEGIEFGHLYRSATETARVGGDFYDVFELEHNKVGIVIGDVSGKGIKAATLTSLVRNTIRAYAYEQELPSTILKKTNTAILRSVPVGNFITLFLGIIDMNSGELLYCSAGHPPALLKRAIGMVELLEVTSPVVGAFVGLDFMDTKATIGAGDVLFLYTDGITEARCDGGFFSEERLVELLKNLESASALDLPDVVFNRVIQCTGGKLTDDVALLALSLSQVEDKAAGMPKFEI